MKKRRTRLNSKDGPREYLSPLLNNLGCGLVSGVFVTGLLNPWDKALYLSITNERQFLLKENFVRPYQGLMQTLVQRSLSTGLYFPLEHFFLDVLPQNFRSPFVAGQVVGVVTGLLLTPLACVKYQIWSHHDERTSFLKHSRSMLKHGGIRIFFRGAPATCLRDAIFGAIYASLRRKPQTEPKTYDSTEEEDYIDDDTSSFFRNMLAAAVGTTLSSPINFVRNIQFSTCRKVEAPSFIPVVKQLVSDVHGHSDRLLPRLKYLQERLAIGWGTLRVAIGMAIGSKLYDMCQAGVFDIHE